jgi:hypothetical protein
VSVCCSLQELGFYRRIDQVLQAVHAGATYRPLTQAAVDNLAHQGQAPAQWQPLVPAGSTADGVTSDTAAASDGIAAGSNGVTSDTAAANGGSNGAQAAAVAADAVLQAALQSLCGWSISSSAAAAADEPPATAADADAAGGTVNSDSPTLLRASSASCQLLLSAADADAAGSPVTGSTGVAPAAVLNGDGSNGDGSSSNGTDPVWLYINHLGWCR